MSDQLASSLLLLQQRRLQAQSKRIVELERRTELLYQVAPRFALVMGHVQEHIAFYYGGRTFVFVGAQDCLATNTRAGCSDNRKLNSLRFGNRGFVRFNIISPDNCEVLLSMVHSSCVTQVVVTCEYALVLLEELVTLFNKFNTTPKNQTQIDMFFTHCREDLRMTSTRETLGNTL